MILTAFIITLIGVPSRATALPQNQGLSNLVSLSTRSTTSPTSHAVIAVAVVVPIVMIAFLLMIAYTLFRKLRRNRDEQNSNRRFGDRIRSRFRDYFLHPNNTTTNNNNDDSNNTNNEEQANRSTESATTTRRTRRNRNNGLRRTDSGHSVKTLPEYKTSLGENEMMLYKAQNASGDVGQVVVEIEDVGTPEMSMVRDASVQTSIRQDLETGNSTMEDENDGDSPQSATSLMHRNSISSMAMSGISALRRSIRRSGIITNNEHREVEEVNEDNEMERLNESNAQADDTPTYESLYPTITVEENNSTLESVMPDASSRQIRGPGTFRNLFRWNGGTARTNDIPSGHRRFASTASVLSSTTGVDGPYDGSSLNLVPTRSNDPSQNRQRFRGIVFPGLGNNASNISLLSAMSSMDNNTSLNRLDTNDSSRRPSGSSSRQLHQRNISAPISIRRLQFEPPVAGFTDQQMAFLTSVESLGKYAIPLDNNGEGNSERNSSNNTTTTAQLPSFEQIARLEEEQIHSIQRIEPTLTSGERFRQSEPEQQKEQAAEESVSDATLQLPVGSSNNNNNERSV